MGRLSHGKHDSINFLPENIAGSQPSNYRPAIRLAEVAKVAWV